MAEFFVISFIFTFIAVPSILITGLALYLVFWGGKQYFKGLPQAPKITAITMKEALHTDAIT
ncbi:MAG: hypothetical protein QM479_10965 [Pseudomonadota bacterium]